MVPVGARPKMKHFDSLSGPRWLKKHPRRLAWWLNCRNVLKRFPALWPLSIVLLAAIAWACTRRSWVQLAQACATHWLLLGTIAAIWTAVAARRRRARAQQALIRSWVSALPVRRSSAMLIARAPIIALAVVATAGLIAVSAGLSPAALLSILLAVGGGEIIGSAGWWLPRPKGEESPASSHAWRSGARPDRLRATLGSLGAWPMACAQVWGRPKISARWILLVLLSVPLGTPGVEVIAAVAAVLVALHMVALFAASVRVAFPAAWWLTPTAVPVAQFTRALVHRAWLRQLLIAGLGFAAAVALAGPKATNKAAFAAMCWLALNAIAGIAGCALAMGIRSPAKSPLHRWLV